MTPFAPKIMQDMRWLAAVLAFAAACHIAGAQQALVVTTAESATRQPARASLQVVDFDQAGSPQVEVLPGPAPATRLTLSENERFVSVCTGSAGQNGGYYASFCPATWPGLATLSLGAQWRPSASCMATGIDGEVFVAAGSNPGDKPSHPALRLFPISQTTQAPSFAMATEVPTVAIPLPGDPASVVPLPPQDRVAVLYAGEDGAVGVAILDLARAQTVAQLQNIGDDSQQMGTAPGGLALSGDGRTLFVLVVGYAIGQRSGEAMSWLYALDAHSLNKRADSVALPGVAEPAGLPISPAGQDACWVATRPRGSDFAYATLARRTPTGLENEVQLPFAGVSESFLLSTQPNGANVALALDDCVQIRDGKGAAVTDWSFKSPVKLLRWSREGLLAGEAGRIHLLQLTAPEPVATVQLQTGHVTDAVFVPETWAPPADPRPPRLDLPRLIAFRGEAVGQEVKALPIQPPAHAGRWLIEYDRTAMPWLVLHPATGTGPATVYMGVDPAWYRPGETEQGVLRVQLAPSPRQSPAEGAKAAVEVRLLPEKWTEVERVLWVWSQDAAPFRDPTDPRGLRTLAELLAGPPHYLAHKELVGNVKEPLDNYAMVVFDAGAAALGLIPRRAVLDYVQNGGAVLFLGGYLGETEGRELSQWLAPAGIYINAQTLVEGNFSVVDSHWLVRHWPYVNLKNGCGISTSDPAAVRVPGPPVEGTPSCVFMTRAYGRGRIAALASQTVLESPTLADQSGRLFAGDLFRWLAGADKYLENQDMDSDGLPDDIEDGNGNGITEDTETNFIQPDSDGDGLPDGMEDANVNGLTDEGETDPLNADSDGDGIADGADDSPAPPAGAPAVHTISPTQGPAEGGSTVVISGRNLPADAIVWFGGRPSPSVRVVDATEVVAETPAFAGDDGGQAPIRIQSRSGEQQCTLPRGFIYTPRSTVAITLEQPEVARAGGTACEGEIIARLEAVSETPLKNVTLVLAPDPPNSVQWLYDATQKPRRGQPVVRVLQSGELLLAVLNLKNSAELARIQWRAAAIEGKLPAVRVKHALAYAQNGQILEARTADVDLR